MTGNFCVAHSAALCIKCLVRCNVGWNINEQFTFGRDGRGNSMMNVLKYTINHSLLLNLTNQPSTI